VIKGVDKMKKMLKTIGTIIAAITMATSVKAQNMDVEAIKSFTPNKSYGRTNAYYKLPGEINGYTFLEVYSDGDSYFSKTALTKNIVDAVSGMVQTVNGSGFNDQVGVGASVVIPTQEKTFAKAYIIPAYMSSDGKLVENKAITGFYAETEITPTLKASAFGEINIAGKPQWTYGEINLEQKLGENISASYNPALNGKGNLLPQIEHRIAVKYTFK
jgi:hypothetical protein